MEYLLNAMNNLDKMHISASEMGGLCDSDALLKNKFKLYKQGHNRAEVA
jgi:hypothetical protein